MDQEIERVVQAIAIASDPRQTGLYQEALNYIQSIQENANETWRLALEIFVAANGDQGRKYPPQARFWALRVLEEFLEDKFEPLDPETFQTLQQALMTYVQSEYVHGSAESNAIFIRNKFSHTLTLLFLCTYIDQWPSFFTDLFTLIQPSSQSAATGLNRHISLLFFHLVLEISGEVADQMIKSARSWSAVRHARDSRVRDAVRDRDAARINEAVLTIVAANSDRMNLLQEGNNPKELSEAVEIVDWGIRTFGSYVGWIDINLTVTPTTVPLLFKLLADSSLPIRLATSVALLRIVSKGLKEPRDKLQLLKVLALGQVLTALEGKTSKEHEERGEAVDEGEESYREALGKLLNVYGSELSKLCEDQTPDDVRDEASALIVEIQPVTLRFLADDYDDTASTVFPLLQAILSSYKRSRKVAPGPIDDQKRSFLNALLQVILKKLKWDVEATPDDIDDDDNAEFEKMRKELRTFMDSILTIDQDLVTGEISKLAHQTFTSYRNGVSVEWNDAEMAVYMVYIFGEINKSGGKGRAAFCFAPAVVDKDTRKGTDYSQYPLTSHGEMLLALVQSGIASFPNRAVSLQFFETVARYGDFFKVRKECILPTLESMIDKRGLHNDLQQYRTRLYYLFYKFIRELRAEIPSQVAITIINSLPDLLDIAVEISEPDEPEADPLTEAIKSSIFESQLYLFETIGVLTSTLSKDPEQQAYLLSSIVKPFMDQLSVNLQLFRAGSQDLVPIVKVHHIVMALGNISKGFPDHPVSAKESYMQPAFKVFSEISQAILVCLEAMNIFKPIRDAARFAFARILATAGPSVTGSILPLMNHLLAHFEPSELVDFMNFIGLLIHKLQKDMFDVLDKLIGPLHAHIMTILSQAASGTDELRAHLETKKAYLNLLNAVVNSRLEGIFTSERNSGSFEALLGSMLRLLEDVSDPPSQKASLAFFSRCVTVWGQPPGSPTTAETPGSLPGFDRFIYEQLVPTAFNVLSLPNFNPKDGQMMVVVHEVANLLQTVCKTRGAEAYTYFLSAFLPSKGWPTDTAMDFTTKLRDYDGKAFRKYFTDLIRASRTSS
ncbi:KapM protein [Coprinopsis marcescibilis]|uniref:Exportin-T n=1 Tax=Coprinopsis marcescibilis TaxID=230819 RepID=A0A5C3L651_COPMA|nr:KapM protein [Coprinopsis marcescibilis]